MIGLDKSNPDFEKRVSIGFVMVIAISIYLSGILKTLVAYGAGSFNPFVHIKAYLEFGFPIIIFTIFLVFFGGTYAFFIFYMLNDMKGMDKMGRLFKMSQIRKSYGDSHFEDEKEYEDVAIVQPPEKAYGTILGQLDDTGKRLINYKMHGNRLNTHIAVFGASGSGKTFGFTKPYCYQVVKRRESVIITDPDGGLYRDMAGYFEDNGYVVRRLDFKNLHRSDGWNCLKSINPENAEIDAQIFAHAVISNLVDDLSSIYAVGPMSLLKALILYVFLDPDKAEEEKNIGEVYSLLKHPNGEKFLDEIFDETSISQAQRPAIGPYRAFKQSSPNLRGNLITNLATQLQLLQNKTVCDVLSTDDIDILLPGKQPCAYFCLFPDSHYTYQFLVSLFFSMLFTRLTDYADEQENGRLPIPVNFLLDEFRAIGKLPDWDAKMSTIRKRGMNAVMIFQDLTQLQNIYADAWENILGNCSTLLALGINAGTTADTISKRIGETSIEVQTQKRVAIEAIISRFMPSSTGEGRRSLLSYEELFRLDKDECLIIFQGHNPIWAKKYPHTLHPESKKLRTILPEEIPLFEDFEARARRRKAEEKRVSEYLNAHPLDKVDRSYADVCEPEPLPPTQKEKVKATVDEKKNALLVKMGLRTEDEELELVFDDEFDLVEEETLEIKEKTDVVVANSDAKKSLEKKEPEESTEKKAVPPENKNEDTKAKSEEKNVTQAEAVCEEADTREAEIAAKRKAKAEKEAAELEKKLARKNPIGYVFTAPHAATKGEGMPPAKRKCD